MFFFFGKNKLSFIHAVYILVYRRSPWPAHHLNYPNDFLGEPTSTYFHPLTFNLLREIGFVSFFKIGIKGCELFCVLIAK